MYSYVSKLSRQHRAYEPFSVTSGFKSVCLFMIQEDSGSAISMQKLTSVI